MQTVRRLVTFVLVSLTAVLGLAGAVAAPAHADPNTDEQQFLAAINNVRAQHGVAPLGTDGQLISIARSWSAQMASNGDISHNPNLANQVSNWQKIGENVGVGGDVDSIERAFENSPHHFENMVDPAFTLIGVGVVEANGSIWVTEDYKRPMTAAAASPAPRSVPPRSAAPRTVAAPRPAPAPAPAPAPLHVAAVPVQPVPVTPPTTADTTPPSTVPAPTPVPEVAGVPLRVHRPRLAGSVLGAGTAVPAAVLLFGLVAFGVARQQRKLMPRPTVMGSVA